MTTVRAHVVVEGKVQGVFFRDSTRAEASSNGVTGWVRNLSDGRVEAVLEGEEDAVRAVVDFMGTGPERASVKRVDVVYEPGTGEFGGFSIAPTERR